MSFLQAHYDRYRDAGGDHVEYVIWNDLSDEVGQAILKVYESRKRAENDAEAREYEDQLYVGDLC